MDLATGDAGEQDSRPSSTLRETRIAPEELVSSQHSCDSELARRGAVWRQAAEAEASTERGQNPYVYKPRRGVRVGEEYQAVLPPLEADPGPSSPSHPVTSDDLPTANAPTPHAHLPDDALLLSSDVAILMSQIDTQLQTVATALVASRGADAAFRCLSMVEQVLARILQRPGEERLRRINIYSTSYQRAVAAAAHEVQALFKLAGFSTETDGTHLHLMRNDLGLLWVVRDLVSTYASSLAADVSSEEGC